MPKSYATTEAQELADALIRKSAGMQIADAIEIMITASIGVAVGKACMVEKRQADLTAAKDRLAAILDMGPS